MTKAEAAKYIAQKALNFLNDDINEIQFFDDVESYVKMVEMTAKAIEPVKCPDCGGEMLSRKGKYGIFWGCKRYPACSGTRDSEGKSKLDREAERNAQTPPEPFDDKFRFRRG